MSRAAESVPSLEGFPHRSRTRDAVASRIQERAPGWDALLIAMAVLILTSVARIHMLFPVLAAAQITTIAGGAALLFYLVSYHPARALGALGSPTMVMVALFTGWMMLTVPFAIREERSGLFILDNFLKTVVIFVLIVGCVRSLRDVERLALVYFAGIALYATVVLVQYNLTESWRLGDLITYDANDFALLVVSAVPLGVYFASDRGRTVLTRLIVTLGLACMGVAFVQTGSRGGLIAMGAVALFLLLRHRAVPLRWRVGGIGLLGLMLAIFASQQYWEQMTTILNPEQDYNFTSETGRIQVWMRGLGYLWDRPITGVGVSNFPVAEGILSPLAFQQELGIGVRWTAPHNSFVQVLVELGIPGFVLFIALLATAFLALRRIERIRDRRPPGALGDRPALAQAIMGALIGFLTGAFFLSLAYSAILFSLLGLAAALWKTTGVGPDRLVDDRFWNPMNTRSPADEDTSFILR